MIWAFLLQIAGILLPVLLPGLGMTLLGAALFGGTFIGIVSLVLTMAGRFYPTRPAKMMGKMTIAYGVAQIAAPAITGQLAQGDGSYADGEEKPRIRVTLATGIPRQRCEAIGLGYLNPADIDPETWADREAEGDLHHARSAQDPIGEDHATSPARRRRRP